MKSIQKWSALLASLLLIVATNVKAGEKDIVDTAVGAGSFNTLAAALKAADLVDALKAKGPYTVFAPTDAAFAKLPKGTLETLLDPKNKQLLVDILTYHVVSGNVMAKQVVTLSGAKTLNGQQVDIKVADGKVNVDSANVVKSDIACSNGVIHVIDSVILPASDNIPTTASKAGQFKTLLAAATAAGLVDALSGKGPLTVFAPTDEAFAKLPEGTVANLLKPENKDKLVAVLKYHVVAGRVYSSDAVAAGKAKTLQGQSIMIKVKDGAAMVNNAKLLATDIDASNGVIHIIDSVILPSEKKQAAMHPKKMLELSIQKGAPLYNAGHTCECAKVYMSTVEIILNMDDHGLNRHTTHTLKTALTNAKHSSCSSTQAWTMRNAMDVAYNNMTN